MIILGIDPGLATVGYGIIKYSGNSFSVLDYGAVITKPDTKFEDRLLKIHSQISQLISVYSPDVMAVEQLFFNTNVKTAILVGQARGVIVLLAAQAGIEFSEYTPLQVKQAVVGYGNADKNQIQQMTKILLGLKNIPKPDDTADALAIAICHAHSSNSLIKSGG